MLSLTRIVLGRAGSVAGDAAQGVVDGQVTAKTEVGQVSTAGVSTSESAPLVNTPSIAASITAPWQAIFHRALLASQRAETRLHSTNLSTDLGDRTHSQ
jgi:hypothetical protein